MCLTVAAFINVEVKAQAIFVRLRKTIIAQRREGNVLRVCSSRQVAVSVLA